mgnify:CR=1 FL=1
MKNLALRNLFQQIRIQSTGHDCLQATGEQIEILKAQGVQFTDVEPNDLEKSEGAEENKFIKIQNQDKKGLFYWIDLNTTKQ